MKCPICQEETEVAGYCQSHIRSLENLKEAFKIWMIGYGEISLGDFLLRLDTIAGIGQKTKEMVRFFLENPSRWK